MIATAVHHVLVSALVFMCLAPAASANRRVSTALHTDPSILVNERSKLDLEVIDSFGEPIPWRDLVLHHERKIHIYVVHQVLRNKLLFRYDVFSVWNHT